MFGNREKEATGTKIPANINSIVCKKCLGTYVPPWLEDELMRYAYKYCRNDFIMVAKRDLCPECAERLIAAYDIENDFDPKMT